MESIINLLSKNTPIGVKQIVSIYNEIINNKIFSNAQLIKKGSEIYRSCSIEYEGYILKYSIGVHNYIRTSESKYKNIPCKYNNLKFDSIGECKRYIDLMYMAKDNIISDLQLQIKYKLNINNVYVCDYIADFKYIVKNKDTFNYLLGKEFVKENETTIIEDFKGKETKEFIIKEKMMFAIYGIQILKVKRKSKEKKSKKIKTNKTYKNGKRY